MEINKWMIINMFKGKEKKNVRFANKKEGKYEINKWSILCRLILAGYTCVIN